MIISKNNMSKKFYIQILPNTNNNNDNNNNNNNNNNKTIN